MASTGGIGSSTGGGNSFSHEKNIIETNNRIRFFIIIGFND